MVLTWEGLLKSFEAVFPLGTPKRKLLQILTIVLLFEGVSVMLLFSKAGLAAGILSLAIGVCLLLLLYPRREVDTSKEGLPVAPPPALETPGLRVIDSVYSKMGGRISFPIVGIGIIAAVLAWNVTYSTRPDLGDLDTLSILLGGVLVAYPVALKKFRVEAAFTLLFISLVVFLLVVPQAFMSTGSSAGSSIGNWYVEYMLAKPFAGILSLIGIDAEARGNMVTIVFQDGSVQALGISAYCAGLYSFSIFLAAFFSFVLTFERLPRKVLTIVLTIGLGIAFLGNLLRMVIIGIVGYYRGIEALLWAHENVGWVIFLSWSAAFWYLLLSYTSKHSFQNQEVAEAN